MDKLTKVIGNVEEVENMMKRVPPLKVKARDTDPMIRNMKMKVGNLDRRIGSIESVLKKMVELSGAILRATANNIKFLLEKLE